MAYNANNPNGQATSANSAPVVIASDNLVDTAGNQVIGTGTVTAADTASTTGSGQASQSLITGTPTAGSVYALSIPNVNGTPESFSSIVTNITGTFVGTYQFERSPDGGTTWAPFSQFVAGQAQSISSGTLPGMFHGNASGVTNIRVRCTAYTSGTIGVRFSLGIGTGTITVGNPLRLYDMNNNTQATIKPASIAPASTDTAIVTVESPNSPLLTTALNVKPTSDATATLAMAAANATLTTPALNGASTVTIQVSGLWSGTIAPSASLDGTNYFPINNLYNVNANSFSATINGLTGIWQHGVAGYAYYRLVMTSYSSGTATVVVRASSGSLMSTLNSALPSGGNTIGSVSLALGFSNIGYAGLSPGTGTTGLNIYYTQSLTNTLVLVKNSNTRIHEYDFYNPNASGVWVQMFNSSSTGSITLGTTAATRTLYLPPQSGRDIYSPYSGNWFNGVVIACTTTINGSTAPASAVQAYIGYV